MKNNDEKHNPLSNLVGRELASIEFVRDYFQFRFDGPVLTVLTNPTLIIKENRITQKSKTFCYELIGCIGNSIKEAIFLENKEILLTFDTDTQLIFPLIQDIPDLPESVIYQVDKDIWYSW